MFLTEREAEAEALRAAVDEHIARFRQSLGEEKQRARQDALEQLARLAAVTEAGDRIGRQYILARRAVLGGEDGPYHFTVRLNMLQEAIRLTVPRFDLRTLGDRLYGIDEMEIIGQIAWGYSDAGQHEKAAGIFGRLLTYVREHDQDVTHPSRHLSPALLNYARALYLMGRYEEALKAAEQGRQTCLDYGFCQSLPGLLTVMAECRYAMGDVKQSGALYCQAYYLFQATCHDSGRAYVEARGRERLGPAFPLLEVSE